MRGYFDGSNVIDIGKHDGYNNGTPARQPDAEENGDLNSYAASDCVNIANYRKTATPQTEPASVDDSE